MGPDEIRKTLEDHKHWLEEDCDGWEKMRADLRGAYLSEAYLRGAYLSEADLSEADLRGVIGMLVPMSCPDTGSFVAWKKAHEYIVKLLIPEDARRTSATTRKCRCDKAVVLAIETAEGEQGPEEVKSNYDSSFVYRTGETVSVKDFDEDRWNECSTGIHFFITREEAVAWC